MKPLDVKDDRQLVVTFVLPPEPTTVLPARIDSAIARGDYIERPVETEEIHGWFELTYANYLVLNRSLLQSMPDSWQARFVGCLEELRDAYSHRDHVDAPLRYEVVVRSADGRYKGDPIPHYERGRTRVPTREGWKELP
jgi:hypothetical protein